MLNLLGGVNERFTNTADDIANSAVLRDFARAHDMLALKELRLANGDCVAARTALVAGASGCTSPGGCRLSSSGAAHGGSGGRSGEQKKGGGVAAATRAEGSAGANAVASRLVTLTSNRPAVPHGRSWASSALAAQ